jgi:hypothetical protein
MALRKNLTMKIADEKRVHTKFAVKPAALAESISCCVDNGLSQAVMFPGTSMEPPQ